MDEWLSFLGRLHPVVVHLPIGILLLLALLELAGLFAPRLRLPPALQTSVLALGFAAAIIAAAFGWLLARGGEYDGTVLDRHRVFGFVTAGLALALLLARRRRWLYPPLLVMCLVALTLAGHYGGTLTHGDDYLVQHLPAPLHGLLGFAAEADAAPAPRLPDNPADTEVFAHVVQPILAARCTGCHGPSKNKGNLRLDSFAALRKGGKHGVAITPGDTAESPLVQRILLPLEEEDHMPPKGKTQLTDDEITLLEWWVETGAPIDKKLPEVEPSPAVAEIFEERFLAAAPPIDPVETRAQAASLAAELGIVIRPLSADTPWLDVNARLRGDSFGDAELAALQPIAAAIYWLDLGETGVTDGGLATVREMPNLRRLRLDRTAITDNGLQPLAQLWRLESLNLHHTAITDAGLAQLHDASRLRTIYLWETKVTPDGAAALEEQLTDHRRLKQLREDLAKIESEIRAEQPSLVFETHNPGTDQSAQLEKAPAPES
ncbi:MAG: c-type cytochrome domain-containing protein [Opitutaceae bacterium]